MSPHRIRKALAIPALLSALALAVQNKLTLANRYGMPNSFQTGRTLRLAMRFVF